MEIKELNFNEEEKARVLALGKETIDKIIDHLSDIEPACEREFYAQDQDGFDEAWRMYTENTLLGCCDEECSDDEELEDYLASVCVEDFADWISC